MDGQEGILYVNDKLSKSLRPHFQLIVMASDHGHPPLSSTAVVNIAVTVPDNAPPKFASTEVIVELQVELHVVFCVCLCCTLFVYPVDKCWCT